MAMDSKRMRRAVKAASQPGAEKQPIKSLEPLMKDKRLMRSLAYKLIKG